MDEGQSGKSQEISRSSGGAGTAQPGGTVGDSGGSVGGGTGGGTVPGKPGPSEPKPMRSCQDINLELLAAQGMLDDYERKWFKSRYVKKEIVRLSTIVIPSLQQELKDHVPPC